jgi:hypothetical protein
VNDDLLGKRIKCPGCGKVLLAAKATARTQREDEAEDRPPLVKRKPSRTDDADEPRPLVKRKAPQTDDADEPRPRKKSRKQAKQSSPVLWLALGSGGLLLLAAAVVVIILVVKKPQTGPDTVSGPGATDNSGKPPVDDTAGLTGVRALKDVQLVAYSRDGKSLATLVYRPQSGGGFENVVQIWDTGTGQETSQIKANQTQPFSHIAFSPDGKLLAASCAADREMKLWDLGTRALRHKYQHAAVSGGPPLGERLLGFSPDGKKLLSLTQGLVVLMDVDTGKVDTQILFLNRTAYVACSPVAAVLAVAQAVPDQNGNIEFPLVLYDYAAKSERGIQTGKQPSAIAFSGDGGTIALACLEGPVLIYDTKTLTARATLDKKRTQDNSFLFCEHLCLTPDGSLLVTQPRGSGKPGPEFWSVGTSETRKLEVPVWARAIALSPDGKTLAIAPTDGRIAFIDPATGREKVPGASPR